MAKAMAPRRPLAMKASMVAATGLATASVLRSNTFVAFPGASSRPPLSTSTVVQAVSATAAVPLTQSSPTVQCLALATGFAMAVSVASAAGRRRKRPRSSVVGCQADPGDDFVLDECPYTVWGPKDVNFSAAKVDYKACPLEVPLPTQLSGDTTAQESYFVENRLKIYEELRDHGAVVFRGFELMKEPDGFQKFYEALQMDPCV
ncbi:unnamed protein product, partial [Polarella glacialis]